MHKKIISTIAMGIIIGFMPIYAHAQVKLNDIDNHWAKQEIQNFVEKGYVRGYQDNTFKPDGFITRAEFVRIVNQYFGYKYYDDLKYNILSYYDDLHENDWFYKDICTGNGIGYIQGYNGNMNPNDYITREQAAKIIVYLKSKYDNNLDKVNNFNDKNMISEWAQSAVEGAVEAGYLKGDENKNLNPQANITRAEAVSMLSRVDNKNDLEFSNFEAEFLKFINQKGFERPKSFGNNYSKYRNYEWSKNEDCGWITVGDTGYVGIVFDDLATPEEAVDADNARKEILDYILPTGSNEVWNVVNNSPEKQTLQLDGKKVEIKAYDNYRVVDIEYPNFRR